MWLFSTTDKDENADSPSESIPLTLSLRIYTNQNNQILFHADGYIDRHN